MASLNKVVLIGHLGQDPELRYTQSGQAVCNFSLATSEQWTDKDSKDKKEKTEWHRVIVWAKLAENCSQYLSKGRQVYVEGKLQTRKWKDKEGTDRFTTEIVAQSVLFLGAKGDETKPAGNGAQQHSEDQAPPPPSGDVPF